MDFENTLSSEPETTISFSESSSEEDSLSSEVPVVTEASGPDYTELISSIGFRVDVVVEQLQLQSQYQSYMCGFLLFLIVALLCAYVYKFFRLFF